MGRRHSFIKAVDRGFAILVNYSFDNPLSIEKASMPSVMSSRLRKHADKFLYLCFVPRNGKAGLFFTPRQSGGSAG